MKNKKIKIFCISSLVLLTILSGAIYYLAKEEKIQLINIGASAKGVDAGTGDSESIPSRFSLKEALQAKGLDIEVKRQLGGTCYANAQTQMMETNMGMTLGTMPNLSEIHLIIGSGQGSGGNFSDAYNKYYKLGYGPIIEGPIYTTKASIEEAHERYDSGERTDYVKYGELIYQYCMEDIESFESDEKEYIINAMNSGASQGRYYLLRYKEFDKITGDMKSETASASDKQKVIDNRNAIKEHIMKYGGVYSHISMNDSNGNYVARYKNNVNNETHSVMKANEYDNNGEKNSISHAVCLVGWDDNFSNDNFPPEMGLSKNGKRSVFSSK